MTATWDSDFVFDGGSNRERSNATGKSQTSGTVEDWDLDILQAQPEEDEDDDTLFTSSSSSSASLFSYEKKPGVDGTRFESLLEFLDKEPVKDGHQALPRPPMLYSSYRVGKQQNLPHAPESAQGVLRWLTNLREKVRNTRAVVARPTPKLIGKRECERQPSEELQLERRLRSAEMAFCAGDFDTASRMLKALLKHLDMRSGDKSFALGGLSAQRIDGTSPHDDEQNGNDLAARLGQCAARLVRLTCRLCGPRRTLRSDPNSAKEENETALDAADIATLRRCGTALAKAAEHHRTIQDNVSEETSRYSQSWINLLVFEGLAHLALLHGTVAVCRRNCWCSTLPPLPRAAFPRFVVSSTSNDELRATALADMLLDVMGYSPLTCEQILEEEDWWALDDDEKHNLFAAQVGRRSSKSPSFHEEDMSLLLASSRELDTKLASCVKLLPATSLARAKAALALGIFHLRGGERLKVAAFNSPKSIFSASKQKPEHILAMTTMKQNSRSTAFFLPLLSSQLHSKHHHHHHFPQHAAQTELRAAEMLLFEATCVIEQHATTVPLDLPFYACHYGADLVPTQNDPLVLASKTRPATTYSALACSMGFASLRALARSLDRRSKHAYAALALEVCIAILELRSDRVERCRLQRELAIVSARQGGCDCPRYCLCVMADLDEKFSHQKQQHVAQRIALKGNQKCEVVSDGDAKSKCLVPQLEPITPSLTQRRTSLMAQAAAKQGVGHSERKNSRLDQKIDETSSLDDIHELTFGTDLAVLKYCKNIGNEDRACVLLTELARRIEDRTNAVDTQDSPLARLELEGILVRCLWGHAKLALDDARPTDAMRVLSAALGSKTRGSTTRRVALLSWETKARLDAKDICNCGTTLARIRRLRTFLLSRKGREHSYSFIPTSRSKFMTTQTGRRISRSRELRMPSVLESTGGVSSSVRSCLLCYCGPRHDIGELTTLYDLGNSRSLSALQGLAPTVAAVESVVSRIGSYNGLFELGRLYHLRGLVQEKIARDSHPVGDYPLRLRATMEGLGDRGNAPRTAAVIRNKYVDSGPVSAIAQASNLVKLSHGDILKAQDHERQSQLAAVGPEKAIKSSFRLKWRRTVFGCRLGAISRGSGVRRLSGQENTPYAEFISLARHALSIKCADHTLREIDESHYDVRSQNKPSTMLQSELACKRTRRRRPFRSRHYRTYANADEVALDALRWYRHALECFKARDDNIGMATSASSFARLQLERVIAPVAFDRIPLNLASESFLCVEKPQRAHQNRKAVIDDIDAAARCALSLAALACEPILLLETYLNVAEVHLVRRDRHAAIAHWWEARELFLRLFVAGASVPLARNCRGDRDLLKAVGCFLERLIRFLVACDEAMINENLLLFDILVNFERDAREAYSAQRKLVIKVNSTLSSGDHVSYPSMNHFKPQYTAFSSLDGDVELRLAPEQSIGVGKSAATQHRMQSNESSTIISEEIERSLKYARGYLAHIRNEVANHRLRSPSSMLIELRENNRSALRLLAIRMSKLRTCFKDPTDMVPSKRSGVMHNLVYAIHVASTLVVYCPMTGARYITAFGRGAYQVSTTRAGSTVARRMADTKSSELLQLDEVSKLEYCLDSGLSLQSAVYVAEMVTTLYSSSNTFFESTSTDSSASSCCPFLWSHSKKSLASKKDMATRKGEGARRDAMKALSRDLSQASHIFDVTICNQDYHASEGKAASDGPSRHDPEHLSIRLVCSERAQLVPWECIAGEKVFLTRIPGAFSSCLLAKDASKLRATSSRMGKRAKNAPSRPGRLLFWAKETHNYNRAMSCQAHDGEAPCSRQEQGNMPVNFRDVQLTSLDLIDLIAELCSRETLALMTLASSILSGKKHSKSQVLRHLSSGRSFTNQSLAMLNNNKTLRSPHIQECDDESPVGSASNGTEKLSGRRIFFVDTNSTFRHQVLFLEMRLMHSPVAFQSCAFHSNDTTAVIFVPGHYLNDITMEAGIFFRNACIEDVNRSSMSKDCKMADDFRDACAYPQKCSHLAALFAHAMTLKYCAPVVLAGRPLY